MDNELKHLITYFDTFSDELNNGTNSEIVIDKEIAVSLLNFLKKLRDENGSQSSCAANVKYFKKGQKLQFVHNKEYLGEIVHTYKTPEYEGIYDVKSPDGTIRTYQGVLVELYNEV